MSVLPLLLQIILVPAGAGLICYLLRRRGGAVASVLFLLAAAYSFVLAILLCVNVLGGGEAQAPATEQSALPHWSMTRDANGTRTYTYEQWSFPRKRADTEEGEPQQARVELAVSLQASRFSSIIAAGIGLFGMLIALYCSAFMRKKQIESRHAAYALWALSAALAAAVASNLLFFIVAWELVTVMLFLLVNLGGGAAAKGAAKSFVVVGLSDAAMLLGILLLGFSGAAGAFSMTGLRGVPVQGVMLTASFLLILAGALAKAGAFPLHTWLPSIAESAPTSVMAMLPASIDKLLGIYLLARLSLQFFDITGKTGMGAMQVVLACIGAVTIISAVMMATIQHDLKRLLSFHAVSQVGYMVLGIATGSVWGIAGGLFHMVNHAIYKSCLFLGAGSVEHRTGTTDLEKLGGLCRAMPVTFGAMLIAALAISGVPPLNGFASKWMVYQGIISLHSPLVPLLLIAAVFGSALTLASFAKVLHSVFWGPQPVAMKEEIIKESPARMWLPMAVLAAACVGFGLYVQLPIQRFIQPMMAELGVTAPQPGPAGALVPPGGLWSARVAAALLIGGLVIGLLLALAARLFKVRVTRPFYGGEVLHTDEPRVPGTTFYDTLRRMPLVGTMLRDGEREGYDLYHVGGRYGGGIVEVLRAMHTGELPLYVSWCLLGAVALMLFLVPLL